MSRGRGRRRRRRGEEGCSMLVCPEQEGGDGPPHMKGVPSGDHPVKQEAFQRGHTHSEMNTVEMLSLTLTIRLK